MIMNNQLIYSFNDKNNCKCYNETDKCNDMKDEKKQYNCYKFRL